MLRPCSSVVNDVLAGDRLALSRLLSQVENDTPEGRAALSELFPSTGHAHLIGVTGAPGTGKSSLVNQLARFYRKPSNGTSPRQVAVVAVDPSSPFTGGALLGDRVRMRDLAGDPGVFIRSMASRGLLGGLASATAAVTQVFDAAGFDVILIETVGAGQAEVDIARLAHTTLVIEAPGLGDDIQAIKAGILEIADILVINKADLPDVENTERVLRGMLELSHPVPRVFHHAGAAGGAAAQGVADPEAFWLTPIRRTVAIEGTGIPELAESITQHRQHLQRTGGWQRRERSRLQSDLETILQEMLVTRWRAAVSDDQFENAVTALVERRISPYQAVEALLNGGSHDLW
jgi:LAO/AO transport system kinase